MAIDSSRLASFTISALLASVAAGAWPPAKAPAIPEADGFVTIPGAAVPPQPGQVYKAIFDANRGSSKPGELLPALNMAGSELNALAASGLPFKSARFVVVFHGDALDGILDDAHYRAKFGVANPNIAVLAAMKKAGVELYACGQNVAFAHIDPKTLSADVAVASDALIVLMKYQNAGYALLSF
jgi:intracellular sulfur oxidation DsrE/DsrF family protein